MSSGSDNIEKNKASDPQVHSANSWETADLGDQHRNDKFLRLMGAKKKEHHGKIVIGDQNPVHKRERREEKHLSDDLAEQYEHSMEYRLVGGKKGHLGLGYHPETPERKEGEGNSDKVDAAKSDEVGTDEKEIKAQEEIEAGVKGEEDKPACEEKDDKNKSREKDERKRESFDSDNGPEEKKMKFVKSSS